MSSNHRSLLNENEPFSISRESFDSYRRSFVSIPRPKAIKQALTNTQQDISARSPVPPAPTTPRQSLDSRMARPPRSSIKNLERPQPTDEEDFEDIGLNDDARHQPPKKRSIFARFGDNSEASSSPSGDNPRPTSSHKGFHFPGRKRGQSGQGAELGNIERPSASTTNNDNDDGTIR
ncbi:MAG: hypothetical protein LQ351_008034 [Letrouitia transgressa]|nr:MAG: hypothetical protein LQ351_008034 [Letrouitia transgressa]